MGSFNFHGKQFALLENSSNGIVNTDTIFEYTQDGSLVTAAYHGGEIVYGKIIAWLEKNILYMRYQCLTVGGELKTGRAIAQITLNPEQKIVLDLNWEWLDGDAASGKSQYVEIG